VKVSVYDVRLVLDTDTPVGGFSVSVVADVDVESADVVEPLMDRTMIAYAVPLVSPVTDVEVDVMPVR
jgi:hypothetical protein